MAWTRWILRSMSLFRFTVCGRRNRISENILLGGILLSLCVVAFFVLRLPRTDAPLEEVSVEREQGDPEAQDRDAQINAPLPPQVKDPLQQGPSQFEDPIQGGPPQAKDPIHRRKWSESPLKEVPAEAKDKGRAVVPPVNGTNGEWAGGRAEAAVEMMRHAWSSYEGFAWGHDFLSPQTKSFTDWFGLGLTIVDSLDTLWLMGLKDEFSKAREWVATELDLAKNARWVNTFETTIRVLGGLLSAYHLSGDRIFLDKAVDLGERLLPAFGSPSGIPYSDVRLKDGRARSPTWSSESSTSEAATLQLEFRDLSWESQEPKFKEVVDRASLKLHGLEKQDGLVPIHINPETGNFKRMSPITLGARGDSYYEYLLKQWLQTDKTEDRFLSDFLTAVHGIEEKLMRRTKPRDMLFIAELTNRFGNLYNKMDHLVCFYPGTLVLAVYEGAFGSLDSPEAERQMTIAHELASTCYETYVTPTGLAPEITHFNTDSDDRPDMYIKPLDAHNLLRPETLESFYYLYALTGNRTYQDWGWNILKAFNSTCRLPVGFSKIVSVMQKPAIYGNNMDSFFLSETLKYLYLLLTENPDSIIDIGKWVFNTEAHPLPRRDGIGAPVQKV